MDADVRSSGPAKHATLRHSIGTLTPRRVVSWSQRFESFLNKALKGEAVNNFFWKVIKSYLKKSVTHNQYWRVSVFLEKKEIGGWLIEMGDKDQPSWGHSLSMGRHSGNHRTSWLSEWSNWPPSRTRVQWLWRGWHRRTPWWRGWMKPSMQHK